MGMGMRLVSCDRHKIPCCGKANRQGAGTQPAPRTHHLLLALARQGVCCGLVLCNDVLCEMQPRSKAANGCSFC